MCGCCQIFVPLPSVNDGEQMVPASSNFGKRFLEMSHLFLSQECKNRVRTDLVASCFGVGSFSPPFRERTMVNRWSQPLVFLGKDSWSDPVYFIPKNIKSE